MTPVPVSSSPASLAASSEHNGETNLKTLAPVKPEFTEPSRTTKHNDSPVHPKSPTELRPNHHADSNKEDSFMDADSGESVDTEDGYSTPDGTRPTGKLSEDPLTLSEANALSKRNKFFYKQLRDHLEYGNQNSPIGFVNDLFFMMDPKLHVGPTNRDGTFEKRVRLHFIEYLELKVHGNAIWLCWGTLLDSSKTPIFRRSSQFYRIPGNQSSVLKSHSRAPHDWDVADETSKQLLRKLGNSIKIELDSKWDGSNVALARTLVDGLKLVLPTSAPLDEKGDYLTTPTETAIFKDLLENCLNRSPVPSPAGPAPIPSDPRSAALCLWKDCSLPISDESTEGWTDESVDWTAALEAKMAAALGVTDLVEPLMKVFKLFVAPEGKLTFSELVLSFRRFGDSKAMFSKMIDLLSTGAFNGNMQSAGTRSFLNDQPDGAFLIRYSQSFPENFVLCSRVHGTITQINKIFNQPSTGLEIELEGRLCQVSQWSSIIKSVPSMRFPVIAPEFSMYKNHGIPLVELLADRRYRISAEPFAALPASMRILHETDSSSESGDIVQTDAIVKAKEPSHEDSVMMARHELESKLVQERSADVLSYLSKLRSQSRIAPTVFQEWCLFVSAGKSKEVTSQLHSLLLAFREEPDLWIAFANEVIPRKVAV